MWPLPSVPEPQAPLSLACEGADVSCGGRRLPQQEDREYLNQLENVVSV